LAAVMIIEAIALPGHWALANDLVVTVRSTP
jgi:hypothetical protein